MIMYAKTSANETRLTFPWNVSPTIYTYKIAMIRIEPTDGHKLYQTIAMHWARRAHSKTHTHRETRGTHSLKMKKRYHIIINDRYSRAQEWIVYGCRSVCECECACIKWNINLCHIKLHSWDYARPQKAQCLRDTEPNLTIVCAIVCNMFVRL